MEKLHVVNHTHHLFVFLLTCLLFFSSIVVLMAQDLYIAPCVQNKERTRNNKILKGNSKSKNYTKEKFRMQTRRWLRHWFVSSIVSNLRQGGEILWIPNPQPNYAYTRKSICFQCHRLDTKNHPPKCPTRKTTYDVVVLWACAKYIPTNLIYSDSVNIRKTESQDPILNPEPLSNWLNYPAILPMLRSQQYSKTSGLRIFSGYNVDVSEP